MYVESQHMSADGGEKKKKAEKDVGLQRDKKTIQILTGFLHVNSHMC